MTDNDIIVLNSVLEQKKGETAQDLQDFEFFELFVFEQVLKNFDLDYNELELGRTGGADDGGIDGLFFFINGELIEEKIDPKNFYKNVVLQAVPNLTSISPKKIKISTKNSLYL